MGWGREVDFSTTRNEAEVGDLVAKSDIPQTYQRYTTTAIKCLKFWMQKGDVVFVSKGNRYLRAVGIVRGPYEYRPDSEIGYSQFRGVDWLATDLDYPVSRVLKDKQFSQQTIYKLDKTDILPDLF